MMKGEDDRLNRWIGRKSKYLDVVTTAVLVGMIASTTRIVHLKKEKNEEEEERGAI